MPLPRSFIVPFIIGGLLAAGCGSEGDIQVATANEAASDSDSSYPSQPADDETGEADCASPLPSAELLAGPRSEIDEIRAALPLMKELQTDTRLIWAEFGIQPDHMMVNGLPTILIGHDDAANRCGDILAAVAHPKLVRFVDWTEQDYSAAFDAGGFPPWRDLILADLNFSPDVSTDQVWRMIGTGEHGVTSVTLRTDQEELAAELSERYGELIDLEVGNFPYPLEPSVASAPSVCGSVPSESVPPGVSIKSASIDGDVHTGNIGFSLANAGPNTVHVVPWRVADLIRPGSNRLVTATTGIRTGELRASIAIGPGESMTFSMPLSAAPCDPADGYTLPPGNYEFVVPVHVFDAPADENQVSDAVVIARVPISLD